MSTIFKLYDWKIPGNVEILKLSHALPFTVLLNCSATSVLTHNMAMIQPLFSSSKWNMGEMLPFFGLKMIVKSGLEFF